MRDNPADMEARIFYALAANQTALTTDKQYTQQLKAAAILEPLFSEHPAHPGLAHYIIHAYDHPPLAEKALDAARRYASLAPSVPHALHMPSHTFTRVGSWKESIETNRRSAEAASKSSTAGEELHALDYQAYAYLQIAQDAAAKRVLDRRSDARAGRRWYRCRCRRRRRVCHRGDSGALRARARSVGRCGSAAGSSSQNAVHGSDHPFRARHRGSPFRKPECGRRRHRTTGGAARHAEVDAGRLLDGAGRDSAAHRGGVGHLRRREQGRRRSFNSARRRLPRIKPTNRLFHLGRLRRHASCSATCCWTQDARQRRSSSSTPP